MKRYRPLVTLFAVILMTLAPALLPAQSQEPNHVREVTLDEAIQEALDNNHRRPASRFAVAIAEAQHRQALAAYWPQLSAKVEWLRLDEDLNFIVPESTYTIPLQSIPLAPGTSITLNTPAGPQKVTQIAIPEHQITTPLQELKLRDKESVLTSLHTQWMLYDGGRRKGYDEQARAQLHMMQQEARRTDLEIIDSVKRYYYGTVLARQIHQIGADTLARMEMTLNLTETMYKEGSSQVKKTDWMSTRVRVESLRSMLTLLEKNKLMAQASLANVMGLPWHVSVCARDQSIPFEPFAVPLENLVSTAYQFSPDWAKMEAGIRAAQGAVRTATSGHLPQLALTGRLYKWWNDLTTGQATDANKEGWSVGVHIEIPLFDGYFTSAKVAASRAKVARLKEQQILLQEGLGLQVRDIFLSLAMTAKAHQANKAAMKASIDNRELTIRAYQHGLVETEDVIRAQIMEAIMSIRHYKALFNHIAQQSQLDLIVGTHVLDVLGGK